MNDVEQQIEHYLSNKMTADESKDFEAQLKSDSKLASEYKKTLAAHQLITEAGRLNLKQKLDVFDDDMKLETAATKVLPLWIKPILRVAAILVISFGVYQFGFNQSVSSNDIYDKYFVTYDSPSVIRNSEIETKHNWKKAVQLYQNQKYEDAIMFFDKAKNEMPKHQISFYKAVSYLSQDNPDHDKALQNFEKVLKSDNDYQQQGLWYKALILLKQDKKENAFNIFKNIVENKSYNHNKAKEILDIKIKN